MIVQSPVLQALHGKRAWKAWNGIGSVLVFEFRRRKKDRHGFEHGSHSLWILNASWRIRSKGKTLADSESPARTIARAAAVFVGQKLEAIVLSEVILQRRRRYAAKFVFNGEHSIQAFMYEKPGRDPIFELCTPATVVRYDYDGRLRSKLRPR